jgi:hypothetical protein
MIWLAGLSGESFRQIQHEDLVHYKTLLERSLTPHDAFDLEGCPTNCQEGQEIERGSQAEDGAFELPRASSS